MHYTVTAWGTSSYQLEYLDLGVTLEKVHKVLEFEQEKWLHPFIDYCTKQRQMCTSSFEKDFWKLSCNSTYGKMLEQKRKRVHVHVVTTNTKKHKWTGIN